MGSVWRRGGVWVRWCILLGKKRGLLLVRFVGLFRGLLGRVIGRKKLRFIVWLLFWRNLSGAIRGRQLMRGIN